VAEARRQLIAAGVLAYAEPLYQVLGLATTPTLTAAPAPTSPAARPLAQEVTS
jgi:hypothetical protein